MVPVEQITQSSAEGAGTSWGPGEWETSRKGAYDRVGERLDELAELCIVGHATVAPVVVVVGGAEGVHGNALTQLLHLSAPPTPRATRTTPSGLGCQLLARSSVGGSLSSTLAATSVCIWHTFVAELLPRIKAQLGCESATINARLYKLLLYETGQHFVTHRDTEKEARMFATLVVSLPSVVHWRRAQCAPRGALAHLRPCRRQ